ncbi:MAG: ATP-dependent helicase [Deltaproteobacteria bacterium]|jgi:DNA helicase-2/ATP-dependent DNA helicase PcrA|nr:ATP-dependent helicase [Deltaproteobacteria bacterium]
MVDLATLNENQLKAVEWDDGPLLVLAGPGSGKTRVLSYRIAHILDQTPGQRFRLLALTFTNKAAAEMRGRVEELVPTDFNRVRLTTFHSFATELLQQHGHHINLRPDFQILSSDDDRKSLLSDVLLNLKKEKNISIPDYLNLNYILRLVNALTELCILPKDASSYLKKFNSDNYALLALFYNSYHKTMVDLNLLDFPTLIYQTLSLFQKVPSIINLIRKIYTNILVDEFQDTNYLQYKMLMALTKPDPSTLFVVADDDQIIYQWNRANPARLDELRTNFNVSELQLPENYRCPREVILLANSLISRNLNRSVGKKPMRSLKSGSNGVVNIYSFANFEEETSWILKDLKSKISNNIYNCAILSRTNKLLTILGNVLEQGGINIYYSVRKDEFKSAPLIMLHSLLRLANSREDKRALERLCKSYYELDGQQISWIEILSRASANGQDYLRSWIDELQVNQNLPSDTRALLDSGILPLLNFLNFHDLDSKIFDWANKRLNISLNEVSDFDEFSDERKAWLNILSEINKKFGNDLNLYQLIHELDLSSKNPPQPPKSIPCFTIHSSKGLEFAHVYLIGLYEDNLPSWSAVKKGNDSIEMQEERRNCFVAITRTQESLTMTYSKQMYNCPKKPSRFLGEMGIQLDV